MIIDADDYVEHYGVKGMRWGVRKKVGPGKHKSAQKQYERKLAKTARKVKDRPASTVIIKAPPRDPLNKYSMSGREFTQSLMNTYGDTTVGAIRRGEKRLNKRAGITGPSVYPKVKVRGPRDKDNRDRIREAKATSNQEAIRRAKKRR